MERWLCVFLFMILAFIAHDTTGKFIQVSKLDGGGIEILDNPHQLKGDLVFVHMLFRHGDRTPVETYPTDPWKDAAYWPEGFGQLTNNGKREHYRLGQWIRKRYSKQLKPKYDLNDVYVQSTDVDRTLMSAEAHLAGLFPPIDDQIWNKDLRWQPIPIHTTPIRQDHVLAADKPCKAFEYYRAAVENLPEIQDVYQKYAYLFEYVTEHAGKPYSSIRDLSYINNTFYIESLYNRKLPEWTQKIYPSKELTYLSDLSFALDTWTRQMARLKGGPLLKEILDRFKEKSEKKLNPDRFLWIYSGHDTTISNLLNTMKLFQLHSPAYAATVLFEMRIYNNEPLISVFYKNNTVDQVDPFDIPGCGTACPLEKMYKLYDEVLPGDWEKECQLSTLMMTYEQANISTATGIMICVLLSTMIGLYLLLIYFRRRNYRSQWNYSPVA